MRRNIFSLKNNLLAMIIVLCAQAAQAADPKPPYDWSKQLNELGVRNEADKADYYELPERRDFRVDKSLTVLAGGKRYLVEVYSFHCDSADFGGMTILAAYDLGQSKRLIDAVNVQQDRECWLFDRPAVLDLAPGDQAVAVVSAHLNAGEDFNAPALYALRKGKFVSICDNLPLLYSMRGNGLDVTRQARFLKLPAPTKGGKPSLVLEIIHQEKHFSEDAKKPFASKTEVYRLKLLRHGERFSIARKDPGLLKMVASEKRLGINQQ